MQQTKAANHERLLRDKKRMRITREPYNNSFPQPRWTPHSQPHDNSRRGLGLRRSVPRAPHASDLSRRFMKANQTRNVLLPPAGFCKLIVNVLFAATITTRSKPRTSDG